MSRFESSRVPARGATLAILDYPGSGEPIVMLHGGPGMGNYFDAFPETLSPPYRVVTYDQRGCGASSCDGSFDVDAQVEDLDAIRKHLGANRIHVFGHSWGGLLAQLYAKAHPKHVASLVLCCSMSSTVRNVALVESKGFNERVLNKPKHSPLGWAAAGLLMQFPGKPGDLGYGYIMKQLLPNYFVRPECAPKAFDVWRASKRAWRGTNRSVKALSEDYLATISLDAPVLIVQGEQDAIRETNAVLVQRFPAATNVRVANAGHFPWLEQPDSFARTILAFYSRSVPV